MILFCTVLNAVKVNLSEGCLLSTYFFYVCGRDGGSGWAGWAYAHPDFVSLEGAPGQRRRTALLLAHSDFQTLHHPCVVMYLSVQRKCQKSIQYTSKKYNYLPALHGVIENQNSSIKG